MFVHGDYGPNNIVVDPRTREIVAVVDWEWAHAGDPVEDLAWCEWIVRMHHPSRVNLLGEFFDAYCGPIPAWEDRHIVMLDRCADMRELCRQQEPNGPGDRQWDQRLAITSAWRE